MASDHIALIVAALRLGPTSGTALAKLAGISQPTTSRALTHLIKTGQVVGFGKTRQRLYAGVRVIRAVRAPIEVTRIGSAGRPEHFGTLWPIFPSSFLLLGAKGASSLYPGLPWFLFDMRPNGFMGRMFSAQHPDLGLGSQMALWTDDEVLLAICERGEDLVGDLIVGEPSYDRFFRAVPTSIPSSIRAASYADLAQRSLNGEVAGSSAGGEQPKFGALIEQGEHTRAVFVKFSSDEVSGSGQRMRDLLVSEHIALETLRSRGVDAALSSIITEADSVFLEVARFDRLGRGRRGVVSLTALDAQFIGEPKSWPDACERLVALNMLPPEDAATVAFLDAFGRLIGNTDMHYGNLSFYWEGSLAAPHFRLAPAYDMLPMLYAPVAGRVADRKLGAQRLVPRARWASVWPQALDLAVVFWEAVSRDERISEGFRIIANDNARFVAALKDDGAACQVVSFPESTDQD